MFNKTKAMFGSRLPLTSSPKTLGVVHSTAFLTCRLTGVTFDVPVLGAVPLRVPVRSDIGGTTDSSSSKRTGMIQKGPLSIPLPPKNILNMSPENAKGSYNNLPAASCFRGGDIMLVFRGRIHLEG